MLAFAFALESSDDVKREALHEYVYGPCAIVT